MFSRNKISLNVFDDTLEYAKKEMGKEEKEYEKLDLTEIVPINFPEDQYYRKQTNKNQIVLHHTVSGQGVGGDIRWWLMTSQRIATHIVIDWEGKIYQCYSSKYWGHHIGVKDKKFNNLALNKHSIGIEIDSWGGLVEDRGQWYPAKWKDDRFIANLNIEPISEENVQIYPNAFRGFYGFEKYRNEQLVSLRKLIKFWESKYDINVKYNPSMWDVNEAALNGRNGLWSHVSYRADKSDCHPQPELIEMLESL